MAEQNPARLTKNERRAQAREQARVAREQEQKREKRNRVLLQGGIVAGVVAILAIVALVIAQSVKPAGPGPANMATGGVVYGKDLKVVRGPALPAGAERKPLAVDRTKLPLDVTMYFDYMCPACGQFEQLYGTMLENYVGSGDVQLQMYPVNFLDASSSGTKYSTRAANLLSCVVDQQPDTAFRVSAQLFKPDVQPKEGSAGLSDDELLAQAKTAGAKVTPELKRCVADTQYAPFITANTKAVFETGVQGLAKGAQMTVVSTGKLQPADEPQRLNATPTVIVNGQEWVYSRDGDLEAYLLKVKAEIEQKQASEKDSKETKK